MPRGVKASPRATLDRHLTIATTGLHGSDDRINSPLYPRPTCREEYDDSDLPVLEILLILQIRVRRNQDIKSVNLTSG